MTGLELLKAPEATAGEIADIISAPCPPIIPAHCDGVSCRACWLAWLTGEPLKGKEPPDKRTAPDDAPAYYKQMTEPGVKALRPYWQYDAVNDSKTRPSHLAMDGRVFMADDPIWDTWFPPNGFKCRCTVKTLSKRQMEQRGLTVETEAPRAARLEDGRFVNILPDPQFDTNPAKVRYQPDLTGYPEPLKKAYQEREKGNTPP